MANEMSQLAQDHLVESLANSAEFQSFVGAANATESKNSIYQDILPDPAGDNDEFDAADLNTQRPYAIIYTDETLAGYIYNRDATGCWTGSGVLGFKLERAIPGTGTASSWDADFRNIGGKIIREIAEQAETAGRLAAQRIQMQGPFRIVEEAAQELGDFQWLQFQVFWGAI